MSAKSTQTPMDYPALLSELKKRISSARMQAALSVNRELVVLYWTIEFPDSITACDGWLITGSASSSYENLPWISRLEDFIREAFAADIAMVGICFGHQILAQALGGKVEKFEKGWGIGPHRYDFDGIEDTVVINAWHQDQVTRLPDGATTVGRSEFCKHAAIVYGKTAYSVQAHPEFHNEFIQDVIDKRRNTVPGDRVSAAEAALSHSRPSPEVVKQIKAFFKTRTLNS